LTSFLQSLSIARSDDTILSVNDKPVAAIRDVLDAIGLDVGKTLVFKIKKLDGQERYVKVTTAPARDQ
jgi:S1-C subfamily serine protease